MKHFLDFVVRSLVDNPDDVQITEISRDGEIIYRVGLHPSDIGLVIGKGGRTIGSIRSLINAATKGGDHLAVEVVENS
ncbi:MAG TPA: KH domain-containing protein [Candidatus Methylacidiphilales bacterium]|nr:KH domain-containing protein [Candidatus Methylacidiphilales bacterium]